MKHDERTSLRIFAPNQASRMDQQHHTNQEQSPSQIEKLMSIKKGLKQYYPILSSAWDTLLANEISNYPIAIFSTLPLEAGVLLLDRSQAPGPWSLSLSTLEEFHVKGLIESNKINKFREAYRDSDDYYCIFVISDLGAQFLFIPR